MERNSTTEMNNPKSDANLFSKSFFLWIVPTYRNISRQGLHLLDLFHVLESDNSEQLANRLEHNWKKEILTAKLKDKKPKLLNAITATFLRSYMLFGLVLFFQHVILRSSQPIVLGYLISLFGEDTHDHQAMYIAATALISITVAIVFTMHHVNFGQASIGMRARIAVSSLIYRKTLKLGRRALNETSSGQIVNLLSNDVTRFDLVVLALHYLWILPFQVSIITFLCWTQMGLASLVGIISIMVLTLPVQGYLGKLASSLRSKVAEKSDRRVTLMSEIISGIQVIKMYAWEDAFTKFVNFARSEEMKAVSTTSYLRGVYLSFMIFVERTALFLTLTCCVVSGNMFVAPQVFAISQFFNLLQLTMSVFYPLAISYGAETLVAIRRIENFLTLEENQNSFIELNPKTGVSLDEVHACWDDFCLKDVTFEVPRGSLCAIVGPVGSGKSSILNLILNELKASTGTIRIQGSISYASQEPWLFTSTIRDNILFGRKYDKKLYGRVVKVCALEKDFEQLPHADKTLVGDRGATLSGGQKARINLARAVYRNADVYLLDDPLSAVDSHVGKHIFEECLLKHLKGKTRILVTHQLHYLKKADIILVINNGEIEVQGSYNQVYRHNSYFARVSDENEESMECKDDDVLTQSDNFMLESTQTRSGSSQSEEKGMTQGSASLFQYITASDNIYLLLAVGTVLLLSQILGSFSDYWVTFWTQQEAIRNQNVTINETVMVPYTRTVEFHPNNDSLVKDSYSYTITAEKNVTAEVTVRDNAAIVDTYTALHVYLGLVISLIIFAFVRSVLYFKLSTMISTSLHNRMFTNLLGASMKFFNTNPAGRILNRFSKDMGAVDEVLPKVLLEATSIALTMCGIVIMVVISNYYMIPVIIVLGCFFLKIRSWFIVVTKHVKHMEGAVKSSVFSHLSSSFQGVKTIRALDAKESLQKEFDQYQDIHTSVWFLLITATSSFGLWLDLLCIIFIACTSFSFILLNQYNQISGSLVGLAISQSLILTGMLQYGVRQNAEVVNQLTSVERILQYDDIEKEGPVETPEVNFPLSSWPRHGFILIENLSLRYGPNKPSVLKNLNVEIQAGEKVGIVGRTGAGKSSLIAALFRLTETSGSIYIDGVDTKAISIRELRSRISIIPQDPVLFSTTIRQNLDPFDEFTDHHIWRVLGEVQLKQVVKSLSARVERNGSNFSVGQRQLVCLARAMLRDNRILVMDEATANTDDKTDALIQDMIRKQFQDCTVLTVAHRLHTVMDSDKIMVIENGEIIEYDHPYLLLQRPRTAFYKMVLETGLATSNFLEDIALDAFLNKQASGPGDS